MNIDNIVERVKSILIEPQTEWPIIADEPATVADLYKNYILILAAIPAVCGFIKGSLIGFEVPMVGTISVGIAAGLAGMVVSYALGIVQIYVMSMIIDALAPTFGAQQNPLQALKLAAYSFTAAWIAGFGQIIPWIGVLVAVAGGLYSIYLFYVGVPVMTKCPADQAMSYSIVSIAAAIVLSFIISHVVGTIAGGASPGHISRSDIDYTKGSPMGTVNDRTRKLEDSIRQAEKAPNDPQAPKDDDAQDD